MYWTRLENTSLWTKAKAVYESDPRRLFHNWHHIERRYMHAELTFGLPYDLELDKAILCHDVIYDEHPHKELRSALWLNENDPGDSLSAMSHIMATANHAPGADNRMVLIDLADLMDRARIAPDRELVKGELTALYGISEKDFAAGNADFFRQMRRHLGDGVLDTLPRWEREAFKNIRSGVETIIDICRAEIEASAPTRAT